MAHVEHFEIPADDLERAQRFYLEVLGFGGSQVGEIQTMDGNARWVYLKDSEGNVIGLYDEAGAE